MPLIMWLVSLALGWMLINVVVLWPLWLVGMAGSRLWAWWHPKPVRTQAELAAESRQRERNGRLKPFYDWCEREAHRDVAERVARMAHAARGGRIRT
jgi:hypothetical protein